MPTTAPAVATVPLTTRELTLLAAAASLVVRGECPSIRNLARAAGIRKDTVGRLRTGLVDRGRWPYPVRGGRIIPPIGGGDDRPYDQPAPAEIHAACRAFRAEWSPARWARECPVAHVRLDRPVPLLFPEEWWRGSRAT
jgi:hypothetical protein